MGREISSFFMSKITKKTFDDYGNDFRAGRKNIDDLYTKMIDDLAAASREESKFQYVMKDVFEVMRSLGWTGDDSFEVNVGGCSAQELQPTQMQIQSGQNLMGRLLINLMPLSSLKTQTRTLWSLLKHLNFQRVSKNL